MTFHSFRPVRTLALVAVTAAVAAACGGGGGDNGGTSAGELSGKIVVDGSSTVEPVTTAVAEEFRAEQGGIDVTVGTSGTGGGFKRFCNDEIDIADASRPIKQEEVDACKAASVAYTEFRVALDGLAIVTSAENEFLECLDYEQLASIFKEGGAGSWNEVDPEFPKEDVAIFAPGTDSGTYDFFIEEVLGEDVKARSDYTASEDDNTLVQGITGEENSWGYFGFAYFRENEDSLKAIEVAEEKGGTCVAPNDETIESGDYPLSRPLFVYVKNSSLERPEVAEFMRFYLEVAPELVSDVGYTAAPAEDYEEGLSKLDS